MEKTNIRAYTLQELANVLVQHGEKAFRAKQIWQWLWQKGVTRFEDMTNLSKDFREFLDNHFILQTATLTHKQESSDGTTKLGFTLPDGNLIETVLIPSKDKSTVCVSSQVGCKLKCSFCATGGLGFTRNLLPEEIFDQVVAVKRLGEERGLPPIQHRTDGHGRTTSELRECPCRHRTHHWQRMDWECPLSPHAIHLRHRGRHQATGR